MEPKDLISIEKKEYEKLLKDSRTLQAYRDAGVDNWEGSGNVHDILVAKHPEYKEEE